MKSVIVRFFSTVVVLAGIGLYVSGCTMPEEKKSLFQRAITTETDSARSREQNSGSNSEDKKDQKKPRAFSKIDRVEV